ncbi:recombinase family protein [Rhizobium leguminosarum]|nr:recombinase family protein [Rhizobium leguminosarum]AVC52630.1 resolvase, N terminal domain protein [Rhizobium leguminosarum bv. viciae]MBB5262707.1 hypothetical protein [Rhizobium leguminosarum]MDX5999926.1 recombinase family protein [Rhizobium leguminosarum]
MLMEKIQYVGAGFQSLTEAIDTTSPAGRMMMQMVGAFAEFERANCVNAQIWSGRRTKEWPHWWAPPQAQGAQEQEIVNLVRTGQKLGDSRLRIEPAAGRRID